MAAMRLDIPEKDVEIFKSLSSLDASLAETLLNAMSDAKAIDSLDAFVAAVASTSGMDKAQTRGFVVALTSAYGALGNARDSTTSPTETIIAALRDKITDEREIKALETRLGRALSMHATLGVVAKARRLRYAFQEHYVQSKIVSGLRPIFSEDAARAMVAGIVTHELQVRVHGAKYGEHSIGLTERDLRSLRSQIDDALTKHKAMADKFGALLPLVGE